jgi:hypothetical protein
MYRAWIELALNSVFGVTDYECMKPTPSETDVVQLVKNFPRMNVQYRVRKGTPVFAEQIHMNPVQAIPLHLFKIHFNIIFRIYVRVFQAFSFPHFLTRTHC